LNPNLFVRCNNEASLPIPDIFDFEKLLYPEKQVRPAWAFQADQQDTVMKARDELSRVRKV
jgi:hypothetical protein